MIARHSKFVQLRCVLGNVTATAAVGAWLTCVTVVFYRKIAYAVETTWSGGGGAG